MDWIKTGGRKTVFFCSLPAVMLSFFAMAGCSKDTAHDYTSIVFVHNVEDRVLSNCVAGYYADGAYNILADLGEMAAGEHTCEIILPDDTITEVCFFTNYPYPKIFPVRENTRNIFELSEEDINAMASQGANVVNIYNEGYNVNRVRYEVGYSGIFNDDIVRMYIDLAKNGGIIVEMSRQLSGQQVPIGSGDKYWFFSIGNGLSRFQSFENKDVDFDGYTGWFVADVNEQTHECSLEFELFKNNEPFANGNISRIFERIPNR